MSVRQTFSDIIHERTAHIDVEEAGIDSVTWLRGCALVRLQSGIPLVGGGGVVTLVFANAGNVVQRVGQLDWITLLDPHVLTILFHRGFAQSSSVERKCPFKIVLRAAKFGGTVVLLHGVSVALHVGQRSSP